jgi:hypothetical protein
MLARHPSSWAAPSGLVTVRTRLRTAATISRRCNARSGTPRLIERRHRRYVRAAWSTERSRYTSQKVHGQLLIGRFMGDRNYQAEHHLFSNHERTYDAPR